MMFFKQSDDKSCQIVALQTVLSFYDKFPTTKDIKKNLPKHSFGNLITELGVFLEKSGIKTTLLSNDAVIRPSNKTFHKSLAEYKHVGEYCDRIFCKEDFQTGRPVLINVDWYKIKSSESGISAHYVVALYEDNQLYLYDGSNYSRKVPISFEHLIYCSTTINRYEESGFFLFC